MEAEKGARLRRLLTVAESEAQALRDFDSQDRANLVRQRAEFLERVQQRIDGLILTAFVDDVSEPEAEEVAGGDEEQAVSETTSESEFLPGSELGDEQGQVPSGTPLFYGADSEAM